MKAFASGILFIFFSLFFAVPSAAQQKSIADLYGTVAPDYPWYARWLNTLEHPRARNTYENKFLVLHFFSPDCFECNALTDELTAIKKDHPYLEVVAVSIPKYPSDTVHEALVNHIMLHSLTYPVINDKRLEMKKQYHIQSVPTTVLIAPDKKILTSHTGKNFTPVFEPFLKDPIKNYRNVSVQEMYHITENDRNPLSVLGYPSGIAINEEEQQLFVCEPRYNRISILSIAGPVIGCIGNTEADSVDGSFHAAGFNHPTGVAFDQENKWLYIADSKNNKIRRADLEKEEVTTILRAADGMNYPTDLVFKNGALYICMTGSNQIWKYTPETNEAKPLAGDGEKGFADGPTGNARFAHPRGIEVDASGVIYVADSENNVIRQVKEGQVTTIAGKAGEFGNNTGKIDDTRFIYPTDVVLLEGILHVADARDHSIKSIRSNRKKSDLLAGTGKPGSGNGPGKSATFDYPGSMVSMGDMLYISDANNGLIRKLNWRNGEVSSLRLLNHEFLHFPVHDGPARLENLKGIIVRPGINKVQLSIDTAGAYQLIKGAPNYVFLNSRQENIALDANRLDEGIVEITIDEDKDHLQYFILDFLLYFQRKDQPEIQKFRKFSVMTNTKKVSIRKEEKQERIIKAWN